MGRKLDSLFIGTDDRRQRLRLRRFFMALVSYAMWFGMALVIHQAGLLQIGNRAVLLIFLAILFTQAVFYALFRSGLNLRFADPSLTLPQILVALGFALVLAGGTHEVRGLVMAVFMVTLLFGIFALSRREFLLLAVIAILGYAALVAGEHWLLPEHRGLELDLITLMVLAAVLAWTAFFGSYVSNLRYRLRRRNDELEQALGRIQELAERDDLTGLYNRRYITETLQQLKLRADRRGERFAICILDLDHFKRINDAFGHEAGDRVLIEFARMARSTVRDMDLVGLSEREDRTVGRFGGEEFLIVLPATDLTGALQCAERLRVAQEEVLRQQHGASSTLSAGVAEYVPGESIGNLLRRADRALYRAKESGRNRVVAADENELREP